MAAIKGQLPISSENAKVISAQVPSTKEFLFVKLPDRILLIDPDQQQVAEIILNDSDSNPGVQPR